MTVLAHVLGPRSNQRRYPLHVRVQARSCEYKFARGSAATFRLDEDDVNWNLGRLVGGRQRSSRGSCRGDVDVLGSATI